MRSRRRFCSRVPGFTALLFAPALLAQDGAPSVVARPDAAALARPCLACHGTPDTRTIPEIRGSDSLRMVARLREYRDVLTHSVMHRIARGYPDEDYARLAEYFHDLRREPR